MTLQHAGNWLPSHTQRYRPLTAVVESAYATLVSPRTGLISSLVETRFGTESFALWQCQAIPSDMARLGYCTNRDLLWGAGYGLTRQEAVIAAMGETVERYAASLVNSQQTIVWAAYDELSLPAVPPTQFAGPSQSERERFPDLAVFDPAQPIGWVQAQRLADGEIVLVPATFVYMGYKSQPHERFGPGISTGLAAGPNWQWAVFKGLCECVERDAFMITYLNRLPVPEIDLTTVTSARIQDLLHRIPAWEKIEIRAWQMTLDIGIPAILAITHTPGNESAPAIACGAAVHVNPEAALFKAILESLQTRAWITHFLLPTYQQRHFALDFSDVSTRPDHLGLASQSGYLSHLDWLLSQREKIPFAGLADVNGPADLDQALSALAEAGFSAITCDLTTPDVAQAGFHVCRVLIPGLQQLTFGPIRLLGNPRLYSAPYHAGITPAPTQEADTNPVPHPFP